MSWPPDVPDLPIKKPKIIEHLEEMHPAIREAMDRVEVQETIEEVAHAVAKAYQDQTAKANGNYEECVEIVSIALSMTGSSFNDQVGLAMISSSEKLAQKACRLIFPA